jgi:hypothetical protein
MRLLIKLLTPVFLTLGMLLSVASAQHNVAALGDITAAAAANGITLSFEDVNVTESGRIEAIKVTAESAGATLRAALLILEGYQKTENGLFLELFELRGVLGKFAESEGYEAGEFRADRIILTDLVMPPGKVTEYDGPTDYYSTMRFEEVSLSSLGETFFRVKMISGEAGFDETGKKFSEVIAASGIEADPTFLNDEDVSREAKVLGFDTVSGELHMRYTYSIDEQTVTLDQFDFDVREAGTFTLGLMLGGVSPDVWDNLNSPLFTEGLSKDDIERIEMKELAAATQLTVINANLGFTDGGLAQKLLERWGKELGMPPDQLANAIPAMISLGLKDSIMVDFRMMLSEAFGTFFQRKGSLIVAVKPDKPTLIMPLILTTAIDPQAAIYAHNLTIEARE